MSLRSLRTEGWRNDVACIPQGSNPTIFNMNELMGLPHSTSLRERNDKQKSGMLSAQVHHVTSRPGEESRTSAKISGSRYKLTMI
jgi:hypothetical protein